MILRTGTSYWQAIDQPGLETPPLPGNLTCEVAVLGSGITGALIAYFLTRIGIKTILLDKRPLGSGSTLASTGLLLYEVDTPLVELIGKVGETAALHAYRRGRQAIDEIELLVEELGADCGFTRRETLYFASSPSHWHRLKREFECRRDAGFDVELLDRGGLADRTTIRAEGAIISRGDAQIDPCALTQRLLHRAQIMGLSMYGEAEVTRVTELDDDVRLHTDGGVVSAQKVVFATGYDSYRYLDEPVGTLHSTYVATSAPMSNFAGWPDGCLIWETARPYFYARQTDDGRAMIGGGDSSFSSAQRRDGMIEHKTARLKQRFEHLFPQLEFVPAFSWAGTFAESKDGLPYIGQPPGRRNSYFALGYGGNGITFSMIAARAICDLYLGIHNIDADVFHFGR